MVKIKRSLFVFTLLMMLSFNAIVWAFPNEPTGFRGIAWGTSYEDVAKKYPVNTYNISSKQNSETIKSYSFFIDEPSICGFTINNPIVVYFYNDKLHSVWLDLDINNDTSSEFLEEVSLLKNRLVSLYGKADYDKTDKQGLKIKAFLLWEGKTSIVSSIMTYELDTNCKNLTLSLCSAKFINEEIQAEKQDELNKAKQGW